MKTVETDTRVAFVDDEGDQIGQITFQQLGEDTLVLDHTGVNPDYRGQGIAQKLMALAVDKARREGKKIIPECSFAVREFERVPEYADVLKEQ